MTSTAVQLAVATTSLGPERVLAHSSAAAAVVVQGQDTDRYITAAHGTWIGSIVVAAVISGGVFVFLGHFRTGRCPVRIPLGTGTRRGGAKSEIGATGDVSTSAQPTATQCQCAAARKSNTDPQCRAIDYAAGPVDPAQ